MTRIFMIRHGQSMSNIAETFTGSIDSPLSELGIRQAQLCAGYLEKAKIDCIYSSDLSRAYMTGKEFGTRTGISIEKRSAFREINGGYWEGLTFEEIENRFPVTYNVWRNYMDSAVCDGGERVASLQKRVVEALFEVAFETGCGTAAVFTHAAPIRIAAAFARGESVQETPWPANSSVSEFLCDGRSLVLKNYGYNEFLGEIITKLPGNV